MTTISQPLSLDAMSLAERLALLPADKRRELIDDEKLTALWNTAEFMLRPSQLHAIRSEAWIVAAVSGRGWGKNLAGSYWVKEKAKKPGTRIGLVARTVADVRDTVVQGPSGILAVYGPDEEAPVYVPSVRRVIWPNGSIAFTFTSVEPAQLRGPSLHYVLADELAAWRHVPDDSGITSWEHCKIAARLGIKPQIFVTTTPKKHKVIRELFALSEDDPSRCELIGGSIYENATLSPEYVQTLVDMYAGTALERQELYGELVLVVEEALWRDSDFRREEPPSDLIKIVGVDPGAVKGGDATGIVVVGATPHRDLTQRIGYVLEDATDEDNIGTTPERWGARVVDAAIRHADPVTGTPAIVVAEKNVVGEAIRTVIQATPNGDRVPVVLVHSISNKAARAEPVLYAYRRKRVFHREGVDLEFLEDEMTTWEPAAKWSPNHMDACVHGLRVLLIDDSPLAEVGSITVEEPSNPNVIPMATWRRERHDRGIDRG